MRERGRSLAAVVVFAASLSIVAAPAARAETPAFEHVHALAFDAGGRALWLGAHAGLFRSEDGGRTWSKVDVRTQHHAPDVMAVAPHPIDPALLYVGTHEAGVVKTTDGAKSWRAVNGGLAGLDVHGRSERSGQAPRARPGEGRRALSDDGRRAAMGPGGRRAGW